MPTSEHRLALDAAATTIERLRPWSRGGKQAPHKPLLILVALRRVSEGRSRLASFPEIEVELCELIKRFSDVDGRANAGYPFWRLQTDGLWEVKDASLFSSRQSKTDPPLSALRSRSARGGFPEALDAALRANGTELSRLAQLVATRFFPAQQEEVLRAVGLEPR
jgi:putative restriction endonuclease